MRSRTLLVPTPRAPRPEPDPRDALRERLSVSELDTLMYVYETRAVDTSAEGAFPAEAAEIPASASAQSMYYMARRLDIAGLLTMRTTTRPNAEHGYNPHHYPTQYAWHLTLTRAGEEYVAHHLARGHAGPA